MRSTSYPRVCAKIIINMVDSDHSMRDTMVRMTGPWEAKSEVEHGAITTTWNLGLVARGGTLPSTNIEALRKSTAINYNHRNRS